MVGLPQKGWAVTVAHGPVPTPLTGRVATRP